MKEKFNISNVIPEPGGMIKFAYPDTTGYATH
jgi:hypothetical protein